MKTRILKISVSGVIAAAIIFGVILFNHSRRATLTNDAFCAVQWYQVLTGMWHADYEKNPKSLPSEYPNRIEDFIKYGYDTEQASQYYSKTLTIRYFPPISDDQGEVKIIEIKTVFGTCIGDLGGSRTWIPN